MGDRAAEEEAAEAPPQRRTAGLARDDGGLAATHQPLGESRDLSRLSRTLDSLERHETALAPRRGEKARVEARRRAERGLDRFSRRGHAPRRRVVGVEDLVVRAHDGDFSDASA